jgi:hypothetical protein
MAPSQPNDLGELLSKILGGQWAAGRDDHCENARRIKHGYLHVGRRGC